MLVDDQKLSGMVNLTDEQEKEGYWIEQSGNLVRVWHYKDTIALLLSSSDIHHKVQGVVERKRREFRKTNGSH
ncbi:MAG: hypothetical protein NTV59_06980 [Chloroflexi bacterium]|nr:hypothetical protein [Chloroflexota bacterium]